MRLSPVLLLLIGCALSAAPAEAQAVNEPPPVEAAPAPEASTAEGAGIASTGAVEPAPQEMKAEEFALRGSASLLAPPPANVAPGAASCGSKRAASEEIIRFTDRVSAGVTSGELMPWDARAASDGLLAASHMLRREDLAGACSALAAVRKRVKLP